MDVVTSRSSLPALRTQRLELRQVDEADLGLLIELNSDSTVMTHIRATERGRAMIGQAFTDPGIGLVFAGTKDANTGSRRVLEKLGMRHAFTADDGTVGYELTRINWSRKDS